MGYNIWSISIVPAHSSILASYRRAVSPVRPYRFCGCGPTSGRTAFMSGVFLNQPISFLLCASPRCKRESAQPNRKALAPWTLSVSPWATAEQQETSTDIFQLTADAHFTQTRENKHTWGGRRSDGWKIRGRVDKLSHACAHTAACTFLLTLHNHTKVN